MSRANPLQLWIHDETVNDFKTLVQQTREEARRTMDHDPFLVLQVNALGTLQPPGEKNRRPLSPITAKFSIRATICRPIIR